MDLLKDITDELRGDDERARQNDGDGERDGDAGVASDRTGPSGRPDDGTDSPGDATDRDGESAGEPERDDEHVCSFCQTGFDADRGSCPECDAEIVLRGAR